MTLRIRKRGTREEWLNWRKPNINASEAGSLLGVDNYRSPLGLFYEKTGTLVTEQTPQMQGGNWMEPAILKAVQETYPDWEVVPSEVYMDDPELRIGCTPDALARTPDDKKNGTFGTLQAKMVNAHAFDEWRDEDGAITPPLSYQVQCVVEAMQAGASWAGIAPMVVGYGITLHPVIPVMIHEGVWENIIEETKKFWHDVEHDIAPAISAPDTALVKRLYPRSDGSVLDFSRDRELQNLRKLLEEHEQYSKKISEIHKKAKPLEEKREGLRTVLRGKMGSAELGLLPGWEIKLKDFERKACKGRTLRIKQIGVKA